MYNIDIYFNLYSDVIIHDKTKNIMYLYDNHNPCKNNDAVIYSIIDIIYNNAYNAVDSNNKPFFIDTDTKAISIKNNTVKVLSFDDTKDKTFKSNTIGDTINLLTSTTVKQLLDIH